MYDEVHSPDLERIPVYWIPGMAASSRIFEYIKLPEEHFESHFLEWELPSKDENLEQFAQRWADRVPPGAVLIGVSLGGILAQEMVAFCQPKKVVLISSVKQQKELPPKMWFARYTHAHKLLPTQLVNNLEILAKYAFGEAIEKRLKLYEKYIGLADKRHIDWGMDQLVNWKRKEVLPNLIHIHGTKDPVFPIQHIEDCIRVEGATHTLVIHRAKWLNERLPNLLIVD